MLERNTGRLMLSVVLFLLACLVRVNAQGIPPGSASTDTGLGGTNTISGSILFSNGQRAAHRITVRLQSMTKGDRITTSDEYGNFVFRGVPSGDYTIVIDKEKDFEPFTQVVSVIQPRGMPPQTYPLSVRLSPKAGTAVKPAIINAELADVPKNALAHYYNAAEQAKKNQRLEAIEELKLAIKEYPSFVLAFNEIGVLYVKLNQYENADEAFQSALKIDPAAFSPLLNRGIANYLMKRYGEAVPMLRKALAKNDQSAAAHYFLGQALASLGLFDDAEKELQASLKLGGMEVNEAHRLLAIIYASRGAKKRAADELEAYLKMTPDAPDAQKLRDKIREFRESNK